jgi:hypothetical protein
MKKTLTLLFICFTLNTFASTSISSPSVSGHWTLAGSPYLVYNNISVSGDSSLAIDPGVSVIFQGAYNINVFGILYVSGSEANPITFTVSDTTGWWDATTATGGWHGIQFQPYSGSATDTSLLQYCTINYTKFDSADAMAVPTLTTLYIQRGLAMNNCTFTCNKSAYDYLMYIVTDSAQTLDMGLCNFNNNNFYGAMLFIDNFMGGYSHFHGNTFNNNQSGNVIISFAAANLLFEQNELYNNTSVRGTISFSSTTSSLTTKDGHAIIRNNKIYNNTNTFDAALVCFSGRIDINANLICNNQHLSGSCGYVDGGGGINIGYNSPGPFDSTFYIVRNNVIANNYSPFHGGGINILDAQAVVANNQIVNNTSALGGGIYMYTNFPSTFKNNLFFGNVTTSDSNALNTPDLSGGSTTTIEYDHNWSQHSTSFSLDLGTGFTITGDTTTNINGSTPLMVSPTLTANVTESALSSNFSLQSSSPCVDAGDTTGAYVYATDYAGNTRIMGSHIDIGAFEFSPGTLHTPSAAPIHAYVTLYPNPATSVINIAAPYKISEVSITDMLGRIVLQQENNATQVQVNVSTLPSGVYVVKINNCQVLKFVKK